MGCADWAVAEFSAPNKPSQLYIGIGSGTEDVPAWHRLPLIDDAYPENVTAALKDISFKTLQVRNAIFIPMQVILYNLL